MTDYDVKNEFGIIYGITRYPNELAEGICEKFDYTELTSLPCRKVLKNCSEAYKKIGKIPQIADMLIDLNQEEMNELIKGLTDWKGYDSFGITALCITPLRQELDRTKLNEKIDEIRNASFVGDVDSVREVASAIAEMDADRPKAKTIADIIEAIEEQQGEETTFFLTGFEALDKRLYIEKGSFVVIGARPSVGKTAFSIQLALNMAKDHKVVYFSCETSASGIGNRAIACYSGIRLSELKTKSVDPIQFANQKISKMKSLNLQVVESSGWTPAEIRREAIKNKAEVVFVDYLTLLTGEGTTLYEQATDISKQLHAFAKQTSIAVIALAQISRQGDRASDISMGALKESGQIEQDADAMLFLTYPKEASKDYRDIHLIKNKDGVTGVFALRFYGEIQRFEWCDQKAIQISQPNAFRFMEEDES